MTGGKSSNRLLVAILAGIVVGILMGGISPGAGRAVRFLGEFFMNALLVLVVPLIIASMVVGVSRLGDVRRLGGLGGRTLVYYLSTTALSVVLGLVLVNIIRPGRAETEEERIALRGGELLADARYRISDTGLALDDAEFRRDRDESYMVILLDQDDIRGAIRSCEAGGRAVTVREWTDSDGRPVSPRAEGAGVRVDLAVAEKVRGKEGSVAAALRKVVSKLVPHNLFKAMAENDVLPLIVFSLVFGAVLTTIGERGRPVIAVFEGLNEAIMRIIRLLMLLSPVGIGALIAGRLGDAGGFVGFLPDLARLGKYAATVIIGLLVHGAVFLPLILHFFGRRRVRAYTANVATALTTAFSTASSSATLPLTMQCVTEKNGVSERTAGFVLPLGATINMDGTALYEAVAAVFIAQIYGIELGAVQMVVIFLTATLAAIGAAGIPQAGLVTMVIVLRAVDLPIEGISLILVIDWFLDRCRTTVNVWGDAVGAAVVERFEARSLDDGANAG